MRRRVATTLLAAAALVLAAGAWAWAWGPARARIPAAERGRRLAGRTGCFACHGPEGTQGTANPGRDDGTVPGFTGDHMMYAESPAQVRDWIADGVTAKRAGSTTWREQRARGTLRMPAFKHRLTAGQIDDLVAFVLASPDPAPEGGDSLVARGHDRAAALGCTGCHGPGGRFARPNAGSFKGYIPSWDGDDFPELVRDRAEFGEWVEHGVSARLERNALARWFLRRAAVHMPAFERHLETGDVDALWAWVQWVRAHPTHPTAASQAPRGRKAG